MKINTNNKNYFYISNELEHGLGLSEYIPNFRHVCLNNSDLVDMLEDEGKKVHCFSEVEGLRSSADLLEHLLKNREEFNINPGDYVQTFKISNKFEQLTKEFGLNLVNPPAELNKKYENKLSSADILAKFEVNQPKFKISILSETSYLEIAKELGDNFVLQFGRGHTGNSTFVISSDIEFDDLKDKFPNREAKFSKYIFGDPYSVNCSTFKDSFLIGGIYRQFTGVPGLTALSTATVGGTFNHQLKKEVIVNLENEIEKVVKSFNKNGFKGLFGLDFIVQNDKVFIIEVNARQQMTVAFNSQINKFDEVVPLNIIHVSEFLDESLKIDREKYNQITTESKEFSQLYLRNQKKEAIEIKSELNYGEYDKNLEFVQKTYKIAEIGTENMIFVTQKAGNVIKFNGEMARIQVRKDIESELEEYTQMLSDMVTGQQSEVEDHRS